MVKVSLEVTNPELDALEDSIVAWNLCKKHNAKTDATEDDRWKFTQTCKACIQINKKIRNKSLHLWSKLVTAYIESTKRKRS